MKRITCQDLGFDDEERETVEAAIRTA